MENVKNKKKRVRVGGDDHDGDDESCDVKRLREDLLLDTLADSSDPVESNNDLVSVMKSFEQEINCEMPVPNFVDLTTSEGSGGSRPELGYLLEASDDELGLPPSTASKNEDGKVGEEDKSDKSSVPEYTGFNDFCRVEDDITDFGLPEVFFGGESFNGGGEYVALEGLFDYPDVYFDSVSDVPWRTETVPALEIVYLND